MDPGSPATVLSEGVSNREASLILIPKKVPLRTPLATQGAFVPLIESSHTSRKTPQSSSIYRYKLMSHVTLGEKHHFFATRSHFTVSAIQSLVPWWVSPGPLALQLPRYDDRAASAFAGDGCNV